MVGFHRDSGDPRGLCAVQVGSRLSAAAPNGSVCPSGDRGDLRPAGAEEIVTCTVASGVRCALTTLLTVAVTRT